MADVQFNIRLRGIPAQPDNFELLVTAPGIEGHLNIVLRKMVEIFIADLRSTKRVVAMEGLRVDGLDRAKRARIAEYLEMVLDYKG